MTGSKTSSHPTIFIFQNLPPNYNQTPLLNSYRDGKHTSTSEVVNVEEGREQKEYRNWDILGAQNHPPLTYNHTVIQIPPPYPTQLQSNTHPQWPCNHLHYMTIEEECVIVIDWDIDWRVSYLIITPIYHSITIKHPTQ